MEANMFTQIHYLSTVMLLNQIGRLQESNVPSRSIETTPAETEADKNTPDMLEADCIVELHSSMWLLMEEYMLHQES
ncbi:hypothetical protein FBEOM_10125 [Fusarium beomiforme]|uniref:Uncharacterized protein n=1 Tax=Fusarium beomiforme TaxID=44412 RepID=A0A9P5ADL7_9HYPO|nr:hypothetical protein FBEOM_10125 [Fusarium beomiforme]